jgi:hypothetical protein
MKYGFITKTVNPTGQGNVLIWGLKLECFHSF